MNTTGSLITNKKMAILLWGKHNQNFSQIHSSIITGSIQNFFSPGSKMLILETKSQSTPTKLATT